ncbi:cytochrome P450 [Periconia macrospinosa]|uniref:Cytochrome P450 n=1 Tax=Periconia macrospinosa TaxID=97972 RepID=A0A2V1EDL7_9PLEO|nr:cytochrome P450 [Periconia macrospinosa]
MLYLIPCVTILLLCYPIYYCLSTRHDIPGPILAKISPLYRIYMFLSGQGPLKYFHLHKKYGPVVRTGPNHISLSDSSLIPIIHDSKQKYLKSASYDVFSPLYRGKPIDTVFSTRDAGRNRRLKATLMENLTGSPVLYKSRIQNSVDVFIEQMRGIQGAPINMFDWSFYWSFDLAFALIFGCQLGYMEKGSDFNKWIGTFKSITNGAAILGHVPSWCPWTVGNDSFMSLMRRILPFPDPTHEFLQEIDTRIRDHDMQRQHRCGDSILCKILEGRSSQENTEEQHTQLISTIFECFFATAADIGVSINAVLYSLLTNQNAYHRLVRELRTPKQPSNPTPTENNPFFTAIIKESLRLHTPLSVPMERVVPEPGLQANGYKISPGMIVSISQYSVHRDREVFGLDAELFRAERWLEADPIALRRLNRNFIAFGHGSRICAGRELGMHGIKMFVASLLERFDVELAVAPAERPPNITMFWLQDHVGFWAKVKECDV